MSEGDNDQFRRRLIGGAIGSRDDSPVPCLCEVRISRVTIRATATRPVVLVVENGIPGLLVSGVVSGGQQDIRADLHIAAPEAAQCLASDLHILQERLVYIVTLRAATDLLSCECFDGHDAVES